MHLKTSQKGDTIVEVLIAIAIIGSVLGTAYALVNRTTKTLQQSQEHVRALGVAQSQIERLKKISSVPAGNQTFCIQEDNTIATFGSQVSLPADPYPPGCLFDDANAVDRYKTGIEQNNSTNVYTVYVHWDGPKGGVESVSLIYKVYP